MASEAPSAPANAGSDGGLRAEGPPPNAGSARVICLLDRPTSQGCCFGAKEGGEPRERRGRVLKGRLDDPGRPSRLSGAL